MHKGVKKNFIPFSIISNSSIFSLMSIGVALLSQSCAQTRASTVNGVREVRKSSKIRPLVLKADSDATVETGIASTSRAKWAKTGSLGALSFHQTRMSIFLFLSSVSSLRYLSRCSLIVSQSQYYLQFQASERQRALISVSSSRHCSSKVVTDSYH